MKDMKSRQVNGRKIALVKILSKAVVRTAKKGQGRSEKPRINAH